MTPWLAVIGIGEDGLEGLSPAAHSLVATAEVLVGGARHLAMAPAGTGAERICWGRPLGATIDAIAAMRGRFVVVLASGDPLWYGVGALLAQRIPREEMTILPQPGAFSLAAAKLGWPIADCVTLSLHGRPLDTLRLHLAPGRRVLALSEDAATPAAVAALLTELGWGPSRLTVLSRLGGRREAAISAAARCWGEDPVDDLNTIAIDCRPTPQARAWSRLAGLPDDAYRHDGQLTKREVRAATLAALAPLAGEALWDIGAGCGSIAIEWLRATDHGTAVAVERDRARAATIAHNAAALGVPALHIVCGAAPAALADLPLPNAAFIGGGIGAPDLLPAVWAALPTGGRLVANVVTLTGEAQLFEWHARHGGSLTRIAVARVERAEPHHLWRSSAAVTQYAAVKP
jgi:precorrin-6Y C5,15-methyltransferase (decarboxylating)